jgi:hypothetical protein
MNAIVKERLFKVTVNTDQFEKSTLFGKYEACPAMLRDGVTMWPNRSLIIFTKQHADNEFISRCRAFDVTWGRDWTND